MSESSSLPPLPPLVPLGYRADAIMGPEGCIFSGDPTAAHIHEVVSVMGGPIHPTVAAATEDIDAGAGNDPFYRSLAWPSAVAGAGGRLRYGLYAYRGLPVHLPGEGRAVVLPAAELFGDALPGAAFDLTGFARLGYEVFEYTKEDGVGTKPVLAYGLGDWRRLNRYCLFDELEAAFAYALGISPDPHGIPYIVAEVWRRPYAPPGAPGPTDEGAPDA